MASDNFKIPRSQNPRQDWSIQFAAMAEFKDDLLLDDEIPTLWDEDEWTWQIPHDDEYIPA